MNVKNLIEKNKLNKTILIGTLSIMLAALLWSIDGLFIRPNFYVLPAILIVFIEHFFGFIVLSPFIIINWKNIKNMTKKSWIAILWVSVFGGVIGTLYITKAFFAAFAGETTFATVIILQKLQPIFALILAAIILKEKLNKKFYFWAILAIISAYFLAFGKTGLNLSEINILHHAAFYSLVAAFAFGSSTVLGKRIVNHLDFKTTATLRFGITSIISFFLLCFTKSLKFSEITNKHWILLVIIVFTSGAASMFLYYFGLRRVPASSATIAELFWPVSAIILDYVINKNTLNFIQTASSLLILIAFYNIVKIKNPKIEFKSKVIKGLGRGKRLGFPTANLQCVDLDISHGVYLVDVKIKNKKYKALMHFGYRKTFQHKPSMEIHINKFSKNIYDSELNVKIIKKLRDVKKFQSKKLLIKQIKSDLKNLKK